MKKKILVLLIAIIPTLMPNLASAVRIEVGDVPCSWCWLEGVALQLVAAPRLEASKDCDMKKKLLVLLIAVIPTLMPNLASAVAIDIPGPCDCSGNCCPYLE